MLSPKCTDGAEAEALLSPKTPVKVPPDKSKCPKFASLTLPRVIKAEFAEFLIFNRFVSESMCG